jgi:outer membrane autotransporter protein
VLFRWGTEELDPITYDPEKSGCLAEIALVFLQFSGDSMIIKPTKKTSNAGIGRKKVKLALLASTAVYGIMTGSTMAGSCTVVSAGVYSCTGAATGSDLSQILTDPGSLSVTTQPGFGINAAIGDGFDISVGGGGAGDLTFDDQNASSIIGNLYGISASNDGNGALSITATGQVKGNTVDGIFAVNSGTDLTINVVDVSGGSSGIYANNVGTGSLSVTATGDIVGAGSDGITANNGNLSTDIDINVVNVSGDEHGIYAWNEGTGSVSIVSTGQVSGANAHGIYGRTSATGTDLTFDVADVSGNNAGIYADNNGIGLLSITSSGQISGTNSDGITANNFNTASDLKIDVNNVTGKLNGIYARNQGSGSLSISAVGTITAGTSSGISASNSASGTDVTVAVVDVAGANTGISVINDGSGFTAVTSTGKITTDYGEGIYAYNGSDATDLSVEAVDVSGANGIIAVNYGSGAISIKSTGNVTGTNQSGIYAFSDHGTDVTVDAASVTAAQDGIIAINTGTGGTSVTATGQVTGTTTDGIYANHYGTDLTIDAAGVTGGTHGIIAKNGGTGSLSITATGQVTGTSTAGIYADNYGTDLSIKAAGVTGGSTGIYAQNNGTGALSITSTGKVVGSNNVGIAAQNYYSSTDLTIDVADVTGDFEGIYAWNYGTGSFSITASGSVTGNKDNGIEVSNSDNSTSLNMNVFNVSGALNGIYVDHAGSDNGTIVVDGAVSGNETGITFIDGSEAAVDNRILVAADAVVEGGNAAIAAGSGTVWGGQSAQPNTLTINNNGVIRNLSGQSSDLAILGTVVAEWDTDDGTVTSELSSSLDIVNNNLITGTIDLSELGNNFHNTTLGIWDTAGGTNDFGSVAGNSNLLNEGVVLAANDQSGSAVQTTIFGNIGTFTNAGILSMQNKRAGDTAVIDGNYVGNGGLVSFDTVLGDDASTTDLLVVSGDTAGTTSVGVNNVGGTGAQTIEGIRIIQVDGASNGSFSLLGDYTVGGKQAVVAGAYAYQLYQGAASTPNDGDWYLRSQLTPTEPSTPLYQAGVPTYEAYPQALLGLNGVPTLQQRVGNRFWAGNGNKVVAQGADPIGTPYAAPEEAGVVIEGNGVWGRIEGAHNSINPRFSTSSTDYDQNVFKLQAGIDGLLTETENGKLIGGITIHYAHGKTDVNSVYGDGEISTNGYGFGGTLTWYGENGFYLDGQGQVTWYKSDLDSNLANANLADGNKGFGYTLSLEGGKRIAIDPAWSLTPQAQLVYSNVDFDAFTDPFGARVSLDRGESLQGRLGLTLDHEDSWQNDNGMLNRTHVYGIANLYYEFLEGTRVDVAGTSFASEKDRLWGGLGVGGSYNWNDDKYSIYGEGLVNTSLNNFGDSYSLKGTVGFRMRW